MRNVVVYELLSLDGVAERPDSFIDFRTDFDEAMGDYLDRVIATQDAVLLGRRTYDEWAPYWSVRDTLFANFINKTEKFVATSKPLDHNWANAAIIDGDVAEFVAGLKERPGGDIGVHASLTLTQALLEAGLVDALRLVIAPTIQMHGRKLFERGIPQRLALTRSITSSTGYLLVDFQLKR